MSQVPDEELISAYLDGEVTDDQRAYVQRLLSENPTSRALYEELRALRSSLQAFRSTYHLASGWATRI